MMNEMHWRVVIDRDGRHSIWPEDRDPPVGWEATDYAGPRAAGLEHIDTVWTDLVPAEWRAVSTPRGRAPAMGDMTTNRMPGEGMPSASPVAAHAPRAGGLPLTVAQKRIWSLGRIGNRDVFPPQILTLRLLGGTVDATLRSVAGRHPSLRARFRRFPGGRIEEIVTGAPMLETLTLPFRPEEAPETALGRVVADFARRPFDLEREPAARFGRIALPDGKEALILVLHPIVADPASLRILAEEILAEAENGEAGTPVNDGAMSDGVGDLVHAEQARLAAPDFPEALAFWRAAFAEEEVATALPAKYDLAGAATGTRGRASFRIAAETAGALRRQAREADLPVATLLLTGLATLLARYGGHWTARLGTVFENGATPERAGIVGRLEDILPLVCTLGPALGFSEAARHVQHRLHEGAARHIPFERLAQALWQHEGDAGDALVRTVFELREPVLDPADPRSAALLPQAPGNRTDADLLVSIAPAADGGFEGVFDFADGVHEAALVARAAGHFARILACAARDGDGRLGRIPLVEADELDRLSAPYPDAAIDDDRPVHELIAVHGRETPDRVAIVWGQELACPHSVAQVRS